MTDKLNKYSVYKITSPNGEYYIGVGKPEEIKESDLKKLSVSFKESLGFHFADKLNADNLKPKLKLHTIFTIKTFANRRDAYIHRGNLIKMCNGFIDSKCLNFKDRRRFSSQGAAVPEIIVAEIIKDALAIPLYRDYMSEILKEVWAKSEVKARIEKRLVNTKVNDLTAEKSKRALDVISELTKVVGADIIPRDWQPESNGLPPEDGDSSENGNPCVIYEIDTGYTMTVNDMEKYCEKMGWHYLTATGRMSNGQPFIRRYFLI